MNLSVIIPSRTAANLIPCVEAVRRHEPEARIVIVDDSPDLSLYPKPGWTPAIALEGVKPFIYARNCNLGIRAAGSDDVILLNDEPCSKAQADSRQCSALRNFTRSTGSSER